MKFSEQFLIIFVLIKSSFGGGFSVCGGLESSFLVLYQAFNEIIDISVESTRDQSLGNSFAYNLECKINATITLVADGTSLLTELDPNIILNILTGDVNERFDNPLDCVYDDLIAIRNILNFTSHVALSNLKSMFVPSSVPDNFDCKMIQKTSEDNFKAFVKEIKEKIMDFAGLARSFSNIDMLELFLNFLFNHQICTIRSLAYVAAGSVNGDENQIFDYLSTNKELSFPLNCTQSNIDKYTNEIIDSYSALLDRIYLPQESSLQPTCQKLSKTVVGLKNAVFGMISNIENRTIYRSLLNPELLHGFIANLQCKVEMISLTIARRLEIVTNVPWNKVYDILQNHNNSLPLDEPLNCIQDDLIQISNRIEYVLGDFIMFLESLVLSRQEPSDQCDEVVNIINNLNSSIYSFIDESIVELLSENEAFSGLNNGYEFIKSIVSQECERKTLAKIYSTVLNADYDVLINTMKNGKTFEFPYNCIQNTIQDSFVYARQLIFTVGLYYL